MRVCGVHWRPCCPTLVCDVALGPGMLLVGSQRIPLPQPESPLSSSRATLSAA